MKRYTNLALMYAAFAMIGGVFYREFAKFNGFTGQTTLGVVHTHYFVLGMAAFLLLPARPNPFQRRSGNGKRMR